MATIAAPPITKSIFNYPPNFPAGVVNPDWVAWFQAVQANSLVYPTPQTGFALGWDAGGNLINVANTGADQTAAWTAADAVVTTNFKNADAGLLSGYQDGDALIRSDLLSTAVGKGAALVTVLRSGVGVVSDTLLAWVEGRDLGVWEFMTVAQKADARGGTLTLDMTSAFQAAIDALPLNTADTGVLSPKGFANGGTIRIPRGRYKITGPLTLKRGIRLVGEGRESTQLISFTAGSVLLYDDAGRYIADEIVVENLSIWQDASVVATSGAAIECFLGAANPEAVKLIVKNVYIEGTYRGILLGAGIGSALDQVEVNAAVLYGIDIRYTSSGTGTSTSTTSTTCRNCYCYLCGDSGFRIERGANCHFEGCASDSNTNYGYIVDTGLGHTFTACGAEENGIAGFNILSAVGTVINAYVTYTTSVGTRYGVVLNQASATTILGGRMNATAATGYGVHVAVNGGHVAVIGTHFDGNFATAKSDSTYKFLNLTDDGGLVGANNKWAIGTATVPETDTAFAVSGTGDSTTTNGEKVSVTHSAAGATRNVQLWTQFISANTAVTYPLVIGHFIPNATKGTAATHTRVAGQYISEQTTGGTANANIMVDAGAGTVPAGNWNAYFDSTRPNYSKGPWTWIPLTSATPANNGDMTFELTSNTQLKIKVKGSDGTVRAVSLTLA